MFESRWQHHFRVSHPFIIQYTTTVNYDLGSSPLPGNPCVMYATKWRVSNATTKIVKKAKIQLLHYVATQNTVKSSDKSQIPVVISAGFRETQGDDIPTARHQPKGRCFLVFTKSTGCGNEAAPTRRFIMMFGSLACCGQCGIAVKN